MGNEWDTWKVGDKLQCKEPWGQVKPGDAVVVTFAGTSAFGGPEFRVESAAGKHAYVYDIPGGGRNPLTYFFLIPPTPTWQVGERVLRENIQVKQHHTVPPGALGTISHSDSNYVEVDWDSVGKIQYIIPLEYPYFSHITTGQVTKPVLHCTRCGEYNEYAEANQADGTHKCFLCRKYPYR